MWCTLNLGVVQDIKQIKKVSSFEFLIHEKMNCICKSM